MCLQVALTFVAALCWQQFVAAVTQRAAVAVRHTAPKQNVPALVCADRTPIEAIELAVNSLALAGCFRWCAGDICQPSQILRCNCFHALSDPARCNLHVHESKKHEYQNFLTVRGISALATRFRTCQGRGALRLFLDSMPRSSKGDPHPSLRLGSP